MERFSSLGSIHNVAKEAIDYCKQNNKDSVLLIFNELEIAVYRESHYQDIAEKYSYASQFAFCKSQNEY